MRTINETSSPTMTHETFNKHLISLTLISVFVLVFLIGTTGNLLVLYLFKNRNKNRLSTMECLICYLALADLLASIINPTMFIYWTITGHRVWHFGQIGCVILPSLTRITVTYSFGIISVITIDRFRVICRPSIWQLKAHLTWVPASVVFILSILSDIPKMVYVNVKPGHGCDVNEHQTSGHYIYPRVIILIVRNILFILVFSTTLYFIYKELYGEEKITTLREQMNLKRAKKIVCLLITMAAIFIMLVFPRDIFLIIFETSHLSPPGIRTTQAIQHINSTLKVLHMCNCLSNPFIYAKLHFDVMFGQSGDKKKRFQRKENFIAEWSLRYHSRSE